MSEYAELHAKLDKVIALATERAKDFEALQRAVVGTTGQSAILTAEKMRNLTILMAGFKDPRACSSPDEELELFANLITDAKEIHGDLYDGDEQ